MDGRGVGIYCSRSFLPRIILFFGALALSCLQLSVACVVEDSVNDDGDGEVEVPVCRFRMEWAGLPVSSETPAVQLRICDD